MLTTKDLERVRAQIAAWRNDLVSMSRRNKLLYFAHTKTSSLELTKPAPEVLMRQLETRPHRLDFYCEPPAKEAGEPNGSAGGEAGEPDGAVGGEARSPKRNDVVASVRGDGQSLVLATPERLRATLRTLGRASTQEYLDKGIRSLYLTFGMLKWFEEPEGGEPCYAPLLLIPVELRHEAANAPDPLYRLPDEDAVINPALAIKLEQDFGIRLPSIDEHEDLDIRGLQDAVRVLISPQLRWELEDRVVLSRFAFHKDVMYRDLLENEDAIAAHEFVSALVDNVGGKPDYVFDAPSDDEIDDAIQPEAMRSILDADASQRKCIWAAANGKSFAMDGPPGTGKSQTIANMISELIAAGRTVLFVSEKAAALEVVYKRLQAQGLHEYVLQLHSSEATRREVAQDLGRSLERRPTSSRRLSASHVETLKEHRKSLSSYAGAMNEVRKPLARSLHAAIGRLSQLAETPAAHAQVDIPGELGAAQFERMLGMAERLGRAWGPVERRGTFIWRGTTQTGATAAERRETDEALRTLLDCFAAVRREAERIGSTLGLPAAGSLREAQRAAGLLALLEKPSSVPPLWLTEAGRAAAGKCMVEVEKLCACRRNAHAETRSKLGGDAAAEQLIGTSREMTEILSALSGLHLPVTVNPEATAQDICALRKELVNRLETVGDDLAERLDQICKRLDADASCIDVQLAEELLNLPCLTDAADRPMANWLDSAELEILRRERATLGVIVAAYRGKYDKVRAVFTDEILDLPVADLELRFTTVHRGFGALRPAHRRDRKLLRPVCRLGKVTREAIATLGTAAELKDLAAQLADWEKKHAEEFGSYYAHKETDFAALDHALKSAESAVDAALRRPELSRTIRLLARGANVELSTRQEVSVLRKRLQAATTLREYEQGNLGKPVSVPGRAPVAALVHDLRRAEELLRQLGGLLDRVTSAGARFDAVGGLRDGLRSVDALEKALREMAAGETRFRDALGHRYSSFTTDTEAARADLEWCDQVIDFLPCQVDAQAAERLLSAQADSKPLDQAAVACQRALRATLSFFEASRAAELGVAFEEPFPAAVSLVDSLIQSQDDIVEWCEYRDAVDGLEAAGLGEVARFCVENSVPATQVAGVFERRVLETWVDSVISQDKSRLAPLRSVDRDSLVEAFRDLDQSLVRLAAGDVMEACNARRPKSALGSAAIIHREAEKKSRHMPIRNLLGAARDAVQALKPCFMMSPLSVSQFLGPDFRFDVVIFDEASQIRPHDAINCLYRGSQHVIAGDQNQLPPTSFFDVHADDGDEWAEDQIEIYESILDKVKGSGAVPSMSLQWHYRSRHEDLITFSNYSFYDGRLITFPSPRDAVPPLGIGFTLVKGVYRRGAQRDNLIEARAVADIVARYILEESGLSIGVVAFSQAQQEAIENAIDELRVRNPKLPAAAFAGDRLDGLFVKNLETVQGDERDVIILSVGYGPDENGKLTMSFGPINSVGGYRRLNVAVTRARMRVEVVSSIRAVDMPDTASNEGVRHLRKYLEYAESGPRCLAFDGPRQGADAESPFEAEVARTIRAWGYEAVPQVGAAGYRIDLGVRHAAGPGGYALGVECDGAAYHSSRAARDRDRLREDVLRGLGWRLHRIWGTSWYRQRKAEETRLREAIDQAIEECSRRGGKGARVQKKSEGPVARVVVKDVELATDLSGSDWVEDYKVRCPRISASQKAMPLGDPGSQPTLCRAIPEIVCVEGPVHVSLLQDRLLEVWGSGRAGSRIQENVEVVLRRLAREKTIQRDKAGFIRVSEAAPLKAARRPVAADPRTQRQAHQVPREEYMLAIRKCQELAPGITRDDLSIQVASVFGWARRGRDIAAAIDAAVSAVGKADANA